MRLTPGGWWLGRIFGYPPFWARLLPYFLVGMAYFAFRDRIRPSHVGALVALLAFAVAARVEHGLIFVLPFAAAYLIFWMAYLPVPKLHAFGKHGDYSYGIYLYAFPIQQIIVHTLGTPLSPWLVFVLAWPASIVASIASWWLIERRWVVRATPARMPVERQVA